eukprot:6206597-Pleurochrysis_carterae.AAC.4
MTNGLAERMSVACEESTFKAREKCVFRNAKRASKRAHRARRSQIDGLHEVKPRVMKAEKPRGDATKGKE